MKKIINRQHGVAMLEFAIILPMIFGIMFAIINFGALFYNQAVITNAAREGARYASIWGLNPPSPQSAAVDVASSYANNRLIAFSATTFCALPSSLVCVNYNNSTTTTATINVSYIYTLTGFLPIPNTLSRTYTATSTMYYE